MEIPRWFQYGPRDPDKESIAEVIEITTRLELHFAGYVKPGVPAAAQRVAEATAWIRSQITGAQGAEQLRDGARAGLDATRGGMASLTDTYIGRGPEDFDMIASSWEELRAALTRLL